MEPRVVGRPPRGRAVWMGLAILVVLALAAAVVRAATRPAAPTLPAADLYTVRPASDTTTIATRGTVQAESEIQLAFPVGGTLKTVNVKVGDTVQRGQVLATLNDSAQRAALAQAEAGVGVAQSQVGAAQSQVAEAQAKLQELLAGPTPATVAAAQAQVAQAETGLQTAQRAYALAQQLYQDRTQQKAQLVAAQAAVQQALTALQTAQQNQPAEEQAAQAALAAAQKNLAQAQQNLQTYEQEYGNITLQQVEQAQQQYQQELSAFQAWQQGAYPGPNPYQVPLQADQTIANTLSAEYNNLQGAQQAYQQAQAALAQAEAQVNQVSTSTAQLEANYQAAEQQLAQAEALYNDRTPEEQAVVQAQNAVDQAEAAVKAAQAQAAAATQPATPQEIAAAKAAVSAAEAGVTTAESNVAAAQAQVQAAQVQENNTVLTAPVSGLVTQAPLHPGDTVGAGTPIFTLDVKALQVAIAVSENQVDAVRVGDPITLTVPELPGKTFTGRVFQVYPTPIPQNGGEYEVLATVHDPTGKVKPGMTGNVTIHLGATAHALMVPSTALTTVSGQTGVYVVGQPPKGAQDVPGLPPGVYFQPVVLGVQGTRFDQVLHGLRAGQTILLGEGRFFFH
ncbi:MAG: efflux RND transporter periplasmic adaptor subunit [Firmicutes bacterium]|nr:efflux RND transporter periplasmic adaptor subunit [Alicyclobacillaceae bacterium]MCL6497055.1 efflux RND transporter periplasmic adaptor subunit [Bacillota bacterium]